MCTQKWGVGLFLLILIFLYLKDKIMSLFVFYNILFFLHFIYNPVTEGVDLGLISMIRLTNPALTKVIGDITTQVVPLFLIFILFHLSLSRRNIPASLKTPFRLFFVLCILFALSCIINDTGLLSIFYSIGHYLGFFLIIILLNYIQVSRKNQIMMFKYIFFSVSFLQISVLSIGWLGRTMTVEIFGDMYVGTTPNGIYLSLIVFIPLCYYFVKLISSRGSITELTILLTLSVIFILPQSNIQIIVATMTFTLIAILWLILGKRINIILLLIPPFFFLIYQNIEKVSIGMAHEKEYAFGRANYWVNVGVADNPKLIGLKLLAGDLLNNPDNILLGRGIEGYRELSYSKEKDLGYLGGAATTLQTTFNGVFGGFGVVSGIIFYWMLFYFLRQFFFHFIKHNHKPSFFGIGLLIYLFLLSLVFESTEFIYCQITYGPILGLIFLDASNNAEKTTKLTESHQQKYNAHEIS